MDEIVTKSNLDSFTQGLKGVLGSMGLEINSKAGNTAVSAVGAKVDTVDSKIDTILENYVTKADLLNALANIGGGEVITIHTTNESGNAHVEVWSGDTVIDNDLHDGDTVTVPFGVEYTIAGYDSMGTIIGYKQTFIAQKKSSSFTIDLADMAVDLGLPSGKLWARCNVMALTPYEAGHYFYYGCITGFAFRNTNLDFLYDPGMNLNSSYTPGDPIYDASRYYMGGSWKTPTMKEYTELINNTTSNWDSTHGGFIFTGTNGNSIFLFGAGLLSSPSASWTIDNRCFYWTCEMYKSGSSKLYYYLYGDRSITKPYINSEYCKFYPIRAIMDAPSQL